MKATRLVESGVALGVGEGTSVAVGTGVSATEGCDADGVGTEVDVGRVGVEPAPQEVKAMNASKRAIPGKNDRCIIYLLFHRLTQRSVGIADERVTNARGQCVSRQENMLALNC
jgi:hypothetical protein